jgi:Nucleotide-binding protein implicated in inhibition of septum formation
MKSNGIEPLIIPSPADETVPFQLSMEQTVLFLAMKKALNVEKIWLKEHAIQELPTIIIAADTIVYKGGPIGKPTDSSDIFNTLRLLRNTNHSVATGVALLSPGRPKRTMLCDVTEVFFDHYSDDEIKSYIETSEPWDKAGSYAIQGIWGNHVSHISGNYDNVIGFPWKKIKSELDKGWPEIRF